MAKKKFNQGEEPTKTTKPKKEELKEQSDSKEALESKEVVKNEPLQNSQNQVSEENQSAENKEILNQNSQVKKEQVSEEPTKTTKPKKENQTNNARDIHCIDLQSFEYIGNDDYNFKARSGKTFIIKKGDIVLIPSDERANYLSYKKTLFKAFDLRTLE